MFSLFSHVVAWSSQIKSYKLKMFENLTCIYNSCVNDHTVTIFFRRLVENETVTINACSSVKQFWSFYELTFDEKKNLQIVERTCGSSSKAWFFILSVQSLTCCVSKMYQSFTSTIPVKSIITSFSLHCSTAITSLSIKTEQWSRKLRVKTLVFSFNCSEI